MSPKRLLIFCAVAVGVCLATAATSLALESEPATIGKDAGQATVSAPKRTAVQLSPYHLVLPEVSGTPDQVAFEKAAALMVRATYLNDGDDSAALSALLQGLNDRQELADIRERWSPVLTAAIARAESLRLLAQVLQPLRIALKDAGREPGRANLKNVRSDACRDAVMTMAARNALADSMVVTVEPLGTAPLATFLDVCARERKGRLGVHRIAGRPAEARISKEVRRLWGLNGLPGQARNVHALSAFKGGSKTGSLQAQVGVIDTDSRDGEPCSVMQVEVKRTDKGLRLGALGERQVVLCDRLR